MIYSDQSRWRKLLQRAEATPLGGWLSNTVSEKQAAQANALIEEGRLLANDTSDAVRSTFANPGISAGRDAKGARSNLMYEMCRLRSCAAFGGQWRLFGGVPTPRLSILGLGVPSPRLLARTGHYLESLSEVKLTPQLQTEKQQLLRLIESAWERYSNWLSPAYSREDCRQDALLIFGPDVAPIDWMAMIRRPDQDTSFLSWYAMNNSVAV